MSNAVEVAIHFSHLVPTLIPGNFFFILRHVLSTGYVLVFIPC